MKKKLPVVTVAERDEAARLAQLPAEATVALQDLAASIKDGLMAFCCSAGLVVVAQLMEEEMTAKVGPKGRHDRERIATRNGLNRSRIRGHSITWKRGWTHGRREQEAVGPEAVSR